MQPLLLSLLHKGGLDIPFMLLNHLVGVNGIVWATPVSDLIAMLVGILLFIPFWRQLSTERELPSRSEAK